MQSQLPASLGGFIALAVVFLRGTDQAWIPEQRGPCSSKAAHLSLKGLDTAVRVFAQILHQQSQHQGCSGIWPLHCHQPQGLHMDVTGLTVHTRELQLQQQRVPAILGLFLQCTSFRSSLEGQARSHFHPQESDTLLYVLGVQGAAHRGPPGQNI